MGNRTVRDGDSEIEVPRSEFYPPYVVTEAEQERWDVAAELARQSFDDLDDADEGAVWLATRRFYHSDAPTNQVTDS